MASRTIHVHLILLSLSVLAGCRGRTAEHHVTISGAFALYPMVTTWAEAYEKDHPEVQFDIQAGGAGKGMVDVLSGTVELAMFSREITDAEKEKGVWWIPVATDAVVPTISEQNPLLGLLQQRGLTQEEFTYLFMTDGPHTWSQLRGIASTEPVTVYTRSDACGAAATWALYLGGVQEQLKGVGVFGDPGLADAVARDPKGIGFNNTIYVFDPGTGKPRENIRVLPIDQNENGKIDDEEKVYATFPTILSAIAGGRYPSPPARPLYLISNGAPKTEQTIAFLRWVLTDGQDMVSAAGYVPLSAQHAEKALAKLPALEQ